MADIMKLSEEELHSELQKIDTEQDELGRKMGEFKRYQEAQSDINQRSYGQFQEIREQMYPMEPRLEVLIEEGEQQLQHLKKTEAELSDSMKEGQRKKRLEWDMKEEDIYARLQSLQQSEEGSR